MRTEPTWPLDKTTWQKGATLDHVIRLKEDFCSVFHNITHLGGSSFFSIFLSNSALNFLFRTHLLYINLIQKIFNHDGMFKLKDLYKIYF